MANQAQQDKVKQEVQELKVREQKVIAHEMAHKTAGGQYAGAVRYQYTTGPDRQSYIVGGEVSIDTSEAHTPEETVHKMEPTQPTPGEQNDLRPVVAEEPPRVAANIEVRPVEKSRVEGRTNDPVKKRGLPWASLLSIFNVKVAGGVGGILLLGAGLAWLAVVAGGAAAFRENSALFRQAHAMGISFLPGIFLLALGVGAVLAVFVE